MRYPLQSAPTELFHSIGWTCPSRICAYSGLSLLRTADRLDRTSYLTISGGVIVLSAIPTTSLPSLATVNPLDVADGFRPNVSFGLNASCSCHPWRPGTIQPKSPFPVRTRIGEFERFQNRVGFCDHAERDFSTTEARPVLGSTAKR